MFSFSSLFIILIASVFVFVLGCALWFKLPEDRGKALLVVDTFIFTVWILIFLLLFTVLGVIGVSAWSKFIYVGLFAVLSAAVIMVARVIHAEMTSHEKTIRLADTLRQKNRALEQLDGQKTEFLSIASHQLRTPLSIIKGYLELIRDGAYGKPTPQLKKVLRNMDETNEWLVQLVDEFLDVTRIEQGHVTYAFGQKNVNDVIAGVIHDLKNRAAKHRTKLVWKRSTLPMTKLDEDKVKLVIFNFIDNAIKYGRGGIVRITAVEQKGAIKVAVTDTGIGFSSAEKGSFFQKFYRGENTRVSNVNGTGLGLYICRKFIENHGGTVGAESAGLKKGSTFWFTIPVRS